MLRLSFSLTVGASRASAGFVFSDLGVAFLGTKSISPDSLFFWVLAVLPVVGDACVVAEFTDCFRFLGESGMSSPAQLGLLMRDMSEGICNKCFAGSNM